jgi:hypothetical protein
MARGGQGWAKVGELLIDLEEDRLLKAVIWGLLREMDRGR